MQDMLSVLREFNFASITVRLLLAMFCGGYIGLERGRKRRAAGFRTYMLVSLGATLTMLLGQYEFHMFQNVWGQAVELTGSKIDVARFGAQVINGIGFLGAGTIIVTGKQEVKGLTTAAGLWASACMGLAIGAGFYECMVLAFLLIFLSIRLLPAIEGFIIENARNMNLYIEFNLLDDIGKILTRVKQMDIQIYEVDLSRGEGDSHRNSSAVLSMRLKQKLSHAQVMSALMELDCVTVIEEV